MDKFTGEIVGDIHVTVCTTPDDDKFFFIQSNNDDVLPICDIIEDTLKLYF